MSSCESTLLIVQHSNGGGKHVSVFLYVRTRINSHEKVLPIRIGLQDDATRAARTERASPGVAGASTAQSVTG